MSLFWLSDKLELSIPIAMRPSALYLVFLSTYNVFHIFAMLWPFTHNETMSSCDHLIAEKYFLWEHLSL